MNKILVVVFNSESEARAGDRVLKELHLAGTLTVYAAAILVKETDGQIRVEEKKPDSPLGDLLSPLVGGMAGLFGGSLVALGAGAIAVPFGVLAGATVAGYLAMMHNFVKTGERDDLSSDVGGYLLPGQAVVVAEIDEHQVDPTDTRLEAVGGRVFRQPRTDADHLIFEQELAALQNEVVARRAEFDQASGDDKTRLQARLSQEKANLGTKIEQAKALEAATQRVVEAKVEALKEQMATANDSRKAALQQRANTVVSDAAQRLSALGEARGNAQTTLVD